MRRFCVEHTYVRYLDHHCFAEIGSQSPYRKFAYILEWYWNQRYHTTQHARVIVLHPELVLRAANNVIQLRYPDVTEEISTWEKDGTYLSAVCNYRYPFYVTFTIRL